MSYQNWYKGVKVKICYIVHDKRWRKILPELKSISKAAALITLKEAGYRNNTLTQIKQHKEQVEMSIEIDKKRYGNAVLKNEFTILMTGNDEMQELNRTFRNKDKPTDVLSFPNLDELENGQDSNYIGDIAINYDIIENVVIERGITFNDHYTHLLVHSILHLLGNDHIKPKERRAMEALEVSILKHLNISNPYIT